MWLAGGLLLKLSFKFEFLLQDYVFSFWFVDLITIKLVLDSRWITLGFYSKYVREINTTRPLLNSTWRNLMEMCLVFQYNLVWKILLIAIISKSVINKSESIEIVLEKEWSLCGGVECSGFTWGVWWRTYLFGFFPFNVYERRQHIPCSYGWSSQAAFCVCQV